MYDEIMFSIIEFIAELNSPKSHWDGELFEQQCYSIWAMKELYFELAKNEEKTALNVIEDFIKRMDNYACKNKETSFMFSVAKDKVVNCYYSIYGNY